MFYGLRLDNMMYKLVPCDVNRSIEIGFNRVHFIFQACLQVYLVKTLKIKTYLINTDDKFASATFQAE